jgi:prolyl 4-hydroxylase
MQIPFVFALAVAVAAKSTSEKEKGALYNIEEDEVRTIETEKGSDTSYDDHFFSFRLFENFQLTADVFRAELTLVGILQRLRTKLEKDRRFFKNLLNVAKSSRECQRTNQCATNITEPLYTITNLKEEEDAIAGLQSRLPDSEDLEGALKGLLFLHDTYSFSLIQLKSGLLVSRSYPNGNLSYNCHRSLDFHDFFLLGKQAFRFKWYDRAVDFVKQALALCPPDHKLKQNLVKMRTDLIKLNNQDLYKHRMTTFPDRKILPYLLGKNLRKRKDQPDFVSGGQVVTSEYKSRQGKEQHARRVCNGFQNPKPNATQGKCVLLHHDNPFLKLGPFKLEVVSELPYIVIFQEFFSEAEIGFFLDYSKPRLSRGRLLDPYNKAIKLGLRKANKTSRVIHKSVQCWIKDLEYDKYYDNLDELEENDDYVVHMENLFSLTKKIELATSLNATAKYASTDYQTTNYGLGGVCESHFDPHGYIEGAELPPHPGFQRLKKQGDMLATVMGWLNDVEAGGATAFCHPGHEVLIWPTRGSAAFWFNLDRKGHRDKRVLHSGCPVIKGSKWIVNKWIYYFDQFKKFHCGLSEERTFEPFKQYF